MDRRYRNSRIRRGIMKLSKLFEKFAEFLSMEKEERILESEKMDKLNTSLSDKIESIRDKIQNTQSERKKEKLKKKLDILKKIEVKMNQEKEKQNE